MFLRAVRNAIAVLVVAAAGSFAYAQSGSATLEGTVTDPTGAVVPAATIHIKSQTTGVSRDTQSNNEGLYSAPNLSAGRYQVTCTASGFATKVQNDVVLSVGAVKELDLGLAVSSAATEITVESSANQVSIGDTSVVRNPVPTTLAAPSITR